MTAWPYPLWIAHRGAGRLAPENTLAAFAKTDGWPKQQVRFLQEFLKENGIGK